MPSAVEKLNAIVAERKEARQALWQEIKLKEPDIAWFVNHVREECGKSSKLIRILFGKTKREIRLNEVKQEVSQ